MAGWLKSTCCGRPLSAAGRAGAMRGPATAARAAWGLALLLAAGCGEHGAMPTRPSPPSGDDGGWRKIYPAVSNQNLNAVWGMDADDMWAVGDAGTILHYDGRAVRSVPSAATGRLVAIDGCARNEAWAIADTGDVLRWDGRNWRLIHRLNAPVGTVCNPAPGEVLVGGRLATQDEQGPALWRRTAGQWQRTTFPEASADDRVLRIWSPGPEWPTMAAMESTLLRFDGQDWLPTATVHRFFSSDGDLVLARTQLPGETSTRTDLFQLQPDGSLSVRCQSLVAGVVAAARRPLLVQDQNRVLRLDDCNPIQVFSSIDPLRGLATPRLAGRDGPWVFGVGQRASFFRLTWRANLTVVGESLLPTLENMSVRMIAGDDRDLLITDSWTNVFRRRDGAWHNTHTPFMIDDLVSLPSGAVVATTRFDLQLAVLPPGGAWQVQPALGQSAQAWWIDDTLRPRAIVRSAAQVFDLWGLEDGAWSLICDLNEAFDGEPDDAELLPYDLTGFAPNDLYLRAVVDLLTAPRLLHFDGARLRRVLPERDLRIETMHAGAWSKRLYLTGIDAEHGSFTGYLQDGVLTMLAPSSDTTQPTYIREFATDLVLARADGRLYRLADGLWQEIPRPEDRPIIAAWARPEPGLFVLTGDRTVYHRDLPGSAP